MSPLAWEILALFIQKKQGNYGYGYIATWTLRSMLGTEESIDAASVKYNPENKYEAALKELVDKGLVEELLDLGERFRLVVKE